FSNTSRLTSIDRYGREATVAADGTITGGTPKRIQNMTYQGMVTNFTTKSINGLQPGMSPRSAGDLNGDGRDELYGLSNAVTTEGFSGDSYQVYTPYLSTLYFDENGDLAHSARAGVGGGSQESQLANYTYQAGRFSSAKKTKDIVVLSSFRREDGEGSHIGYSTYRYMKDTSNPGSLSELVCPYPTSNASSSSNICNNIASGSVGVNNYITSYVHDNNGDGIDSVFPLGQNSAPAIKHVSIDLRGDGKRPITFDIPKDLGCQTEKSDSLNGASGEPVFGDFNGDGATDVMRSGGAANNTTVCLSTGRSLRKINLSAPVLYTGQMSNGGGVGAGDADNDGKTDILARGLPIVPGTAEVSRPFLFSFGQAGMLLNTTLRSIIHRPSLLAISTATVFQRPHRF
ncbi:FG-GAP-like repeat-containing protein, partial [Oryzicola mucosus]